jgi:hypothetical protein
MNVNTSDVVVLEEAIKRLLYHMSRARRTGSKAVSLKVEELQCFKQLAEQYSQAYNADTSTELVELQKELEALEWCKMNDAVIEFTTDYDGVTCTVKANGRTIRARNLVKACEFLIGRSV